ncbi:MULTISPECIES: glucuronate isomerase [Agarivorans]|uniref:glucuronate isomerase n=1 Tax=Agarivorans TaxID=261825 RepID=UPI001C7E1333|nr:MULTISPECIES: glucuronate isomerase [Agarivorans]
MSVFIHPNFLLQGNTAETLYHSYAESMPIIDFHNHLEAQDIWNDYQYQNIADAWLSRDHYLWRALRSNGVDEFYITGGADAYSKFEKWCETIPYLVGNPLYHWCHYELKKYFNIDLLLNPDNCDEIWRRCNDLLQSSSHSVRRLLIDSKVELLCTTDSPLSNLVYHQQLAASDYPVQVLPTFRADDLLAIEEPKLFLNMLESLSQVSGVVISDFSSYLKAIYSRIDYFAANNCRLSDLGLKVIDFAEYSYADLDDSIAKLIGGENLSKLAETQFKTAIFHALGKACHQHGWSMQLHIGVLSNVNKRRCNTLGKGTGFSVIGDNAIAESLCKLLNLLEEDRCLPQTILYSLNPKDNVVLGSIIGAFQDSDAQPGKIQLGAAWWFNDHQSGIEKQLKDLANLGALGRFVGMLTDSRSVLSMSRHDYFRRILCNLLGEWIDKGYMPNDQALIKQTVENICYRNARQYFNFPHRLGDV